MKQKTCKNKECKKKFTPGRQMQTTCDYLCAIKYSKQLADKREAKKKTEARVAIREYKKNDKPVLLQLAQKLVNQYIRKRDAGLCCVSCGYDFSGFINNKKCNRVKNAGHYVRVSKSSFLRFHEDNISLQCSYCNLELDGNEGAYKAPLAEKIGLERLEYLEANRNTLKTWTVEELQEVIKTYREKLKDAD